MLAENHRIQTRSHAKEMTGGPLSRFRVGVGRDECGAIACQPLEHSPHAGFCRRGIGRGHVQFRPVAGRQQDGLGRSRVAPDIPQHGRHACAIERQALPQFEGRGVVVDAEQLDVHDGDQV